MPELLTDYQEAEDVLQDIAERFRSSPLATTETYSFFEIDDDESVEKRSEQKRLFLSGEINNPELNFPILERSQTIENVQREEDHILDLMRDSSELAHDQEREAVLYDLLRVRRLELGLVLLASEFTSRQFDTSHTEQVANLYNRVNDEVNSSLEPARFSGLLLKQQSRAQKLLDDENVPEQVKKAASDFLSNTNPVSASEEVVMPVEVDQERFKKLQEFMEHEFADLLTCVPEKPSGEKYSANEVAEIFRNAHQLLNTGWETRLQAGKSNIDTRQNEQASVIGTERERTGKNTKGILVHEIGIHVQRRINGDRLGDPLIGGLGLPWYLASEEGLTTIAQQAIEGKVKESGEQYYLAVGFSRGLDGRPRDFREVYDLELSRLIMADYLDGGKIDEELDKTRSKAYATALRVRRGTRADVRGVAYTKDIAYFLGNQKMWETLLDLVEMPERQRDEEFNLLLAAKYDPTHSSHKHIVQRAMHR